MNTFEKAREFIYRNASPLDLARWQFHFENGSKEAVLKTLAFYQNDDGGFGHGIEPDFLNPNSSPMATWAATEILNELNLENKKHPIIIGVLKFLESGKEFDQEKNQWLNCVPTNNDFPHAIWWEYSENHEFNYNPTASLAGFILKYAEKECGLYKKAAEIAKEAVEWFVSAVPFTEQHVTSCFIALYNALEENNVNDIDMQNFKEKLSENVKHTICSEKEKWAVEYVTKPSDFSITPNSIFFADNSEIARYECDFIKQSQLSDGSFPITWQWYTDYNEYYVSTNRWKSAISIKNMLYLREYGE